MRVFKIGGRAQSSPQLITSLAAAWSGRTGGLCVVHGGSEDISALQRALGIEPVFVGGRRVTSERDVELVRMALSGTANKRLVSALLALDVPAWGISGEDAGLLEARPLSAGDLGSAGEPSHVNTEPLTLLLDGGYLPVISPVARNRDGSGALNVNGDDAAAAIAAALQAEELVLVSDVAGVCDETGAPISQLSVAQGHELIATGAATAGMAAKLQAAEAALRRGVARVRITSVDALLDPAAGTIITSVGREALV